MLRPDDKVLINDSIDIVLSDYVLLNKNDVLNDKLSYLSLEELGYYVKLVSIALSEDNQDEYYRLPNYEEMTLDDDLTKALQNKGVIEYNESERKILFKC